MAAHAENPGNEGDDTRLEGVVVRRVLDFHPTPVTTEELIRDLTGADGDLAARDGIERAIGDLTRSGLIHPVTADGFVTPTHSAVRLGELLGLLV